MESYDVLEVRYNEKQVGTIALYKGYLVAFEYTENWIYNGFSISPFSLPLQKKLYIPQYDPFEGLFGVFADSLPDGWGRLLVDRLLLSEQIDPEKTDMIDRLAIVGNSGMGALSYFPCHEWKSERTQLEYDRIADECKKILASEYTDDLDELFILGGSSGGARPKILTTIDGEEWIVKFPSSADSGNIGETEYRYSLCAKKCGINMTETRLFPSNISTGYFGIKRFDRDKTANGANKRIHMISASALLEVSHRIPSLDYNSLMKLTLELTKDFTEVEKMYRLMCFNVYAHNRDDHSKNFSYLYNEDTDSWKLSPAYDLTYSSSIGGEHATCINGNGSDPSIKDLLAVAEKIGITKIRAKEIAEHTEQIIHEELGRYLPFRT